MDHQNAAFVKNSLDAAAKELAVRADLAHHRGTRNPQLQEAFELIVKAFDDAAALLRSRITQ